MINKIGNWVFGSFFRTIGRLLVFILLGVIIANLVDFSSIISNFRITDLFFQKVSASSFNGIWPENVQGKNGSTGTYYNMNMADNDMYNTSILMSQNNQRVYIKFDNITFSDNAEYLYVAFMYRPLFGNLSDYHLTLNQSTGAITGYVEHDQQFNVQVGYWFDNNENQIGLCSATQVVNNMVYYQCPIKGSDINGFRLGFTSDEVGTIRVSFSPFMSYSLAQLQQSMQAIVNAQNNTTNAINSQTQQQQQQHEEIMDDNTTAAEDEAGDFLGNFTVEDTGGLNAIITAPLSTIQSLLNNTCTKLVLPLPFVDKNLELPCLYPIYNDYFGAFFTIYQTIILGIISYRCIKSLFFDVKGFTNPEDDRIEVMDL